MYNSVQDDRKQGPGILRRCRQYPLVLMFSVFLATYFFFSCSFRRNAISSQTMVESEINKLLPPTINVVHGRDELVQYVCDMSEEDSFRIIRNLDPLDKAVLQHLKCFHLFPPSTLPLNLEKPNTDQSHYSAQITKILGGQRNGFFIECGANDGEFYSNSLPLEKNYGWTGLLIEAHPKHGKTLLTKNRNAWFADVCVSPNRSISDMEFLETLDNDKEWKQGIGKLNMPDDIDTVYQRNTKAYNFKSYGMVRCFPLVSILAALDVKVVDFFSLDVQGIELKILKTLPYDDTLKIRVLQSESSLDPEGKRPMKDWMINHGYRVAYETGEDFIFVLE